MFCKCCSFSSLWHSYYYYSEKRYDECLLHSKYCNIYCIINQTDVSEIIVFLSSNGYFRRKAQSHDLLKSNWPHMQGKLWQVDFTTQCCLDHQELPGKRSNSKEGFHWMLGLFLLIRPSTGSSCHQCRACLTSAAGGWEWKEEDTCV